MRTGIRFESAREKLAREVAELRGKSAAARIEVLIELSDLCGELLESSPRRERQLHLLEERERLGHARWKELIETHVRTTATRDSSR